nr:hypothetical protein [Tanacetum cinerariifolium]
MNGSNSGCSKHMTGNKSLFSTYKAYDGEVTLPPRKRLDIALGPRYEVGESSSAAAARPAGGFRADYGFVAAVDREIMRNPEREVGYGITDSWDEIVETLHRAPGQQGLAGDPTQLEPPEEAGGSA